MNQCPRQIFISQESVTQLSIFLLWITGWVLFTCRESLAQTNNYLLAIKHWTITNISEWNTLFKPADIITLKHKCRRYRIGFSYGHRSCSILHSCPSPTGSSLHYKQTCHIFHSLSSCPGMGLAVGSHYQLYENLNNVSRKWQNPNPYSDIGPSLYQLFVTDNHSFPTLLTQGSTDHFGPVISEQNFNCPVQEYRANALLKYSGQSGLQSGIISGLAEKNADLGL